MGHNIINRVFKCTILVLSIGLLDKCAGSDSEVGMVKCGFSSHEKVSQFMFCDGYCDCSNCFDEAICMIGLLITPPPHTHTHTHTQTHTHTHTHTHAHANTHTQTHIRNTHIRNTHIRNTHSNTHTLSLSLTHTQKTQTQRAGWKF